MTATKDGANLPAVRENAERPPMSADQLRAEIAHTRVELGETVQALAAKADVKARLQETADEAKAKARERLQLAKVEARTAAAEAPQRAQVLVLRLRESVRDNPKPYAIAAGVTVLLVVVSRWLRSRR
jgi:ElaB/YqjD/DUF883 family membrane-anchored ribosome-binding protein